MFRRSSYAAVAAGNSNPSHGFGAARSGAYSHLQHRDARDLPSPHLPGGHARNHSRPIEGDGLHSNMSTSWGRGGTISSSAGQTGCSNGFGGGASEGSYSSFFVPSYLRGSKFAEKVEEGHLAKLEIRREHRANHTMNGAPLSTNSSSANLQKMGASHRGLSHEVIERAPVYVDETIACWPTRWNDTDKFPQMEIEEEGRQARFAGPQKTHDESASVRADFPMPRQCGIYYFEVTIMSKGKDGLIGIGFSGPKVPLNRIPGWEPESYAYHGDDGQIFNNNTQGKPFGQKFGTLDVVGCGINFRTGQAFFTRNGVMLGIAFKDLKTDRLYYPTVGMKKSGETLKANFGQDPFAFDINKLVQAEISSIQVEILQLKPSPDESSLIHNLVSQYLAHDGYVESARDFSAEVRAESRALQDDEDAELGYLEPEEDLDGINRQKIRSAILEGNVDKALKYTYKHYPDVLRENENIYFKLRCRKFIEMIRESSDLNAHIPPPTPSSKRSTASNGHPNDDYDFEMELDEQLGIHNGVGQWGADNMDTEDELEDSPTQAEIRSLEIKMLEYGAELNNEFLNDPRREIKKALQDTFALIAYKNAKQSTLAPLLEISGRVPIAEELNSAILVSLGKSSSAALERLYQQSEALVTELTDDGGPGAFVNIRKDFLQ